MFLQNYLAKNMADKQGSANQTLGSTLGSTIGTGSIGSGLGALGGGTAPGESAGSTNIFGQPIAGGASNQSSATTLGSILQNGTSAPSGFGAAQTSGTGSGNTIASALGLNFGNTASRGRQENAMAHVNTTPIGGLGPLTGLSPNIQPQRSQSSSIRDSLLPPSLNPKRGSGSSEEDEQTEILRQAQIKSEARNQFDGMAGNAQARTASCPPQARYESQLAPPQPNSGTLIGNILQNQMKNSNQGSARFSEVIKGSETAKAETGSFCKSSGTFDQRMQKPRLPKKEETVSKLSPQQLAMPRISVYVTVPERNQKFLAYLDRRVHHTVKDFKLYLSQSIDIDDIEAVTLTKEIIKYQPPVQITDLAMVNHQDKLMLRNDEWFLSRTEGSIYTRRPPEAEFLPNGERVFLLPYALTSAKLTKEEGPDSQAEGVIPIFEVSRNNQRQNPRFAQLITAETENQVIKTENGYIPQIKPKYLELSTQIKQIIMRKLQEQKEDDELPEGAPRPVRQGGNTIIEKFIDRQREEAEAEMKYSKHIQLEGFKPWDGWVPMPYPHRELTFARKMYMRGDNLLVQTPDFWEFCNDVKNMTNKNSLIWKCKKMSMDRGFRGKVSLQTEGKCSSLIMFCKQSLKSTAKNPSIKAECPFFLHFERRSFLKKGINRQNANDFPMIKDEDPEDDIIRSESQAGKFDAKKFKQSFNKKNGGGRADVDTANDPYFLVKYRSFHNHDLDTNLTEHSHFLMESEELFKKGAMNLLPQTPYAIQWLSGQRRKEIPEEGRMGEMALPFEQITTVQTIYKLDQLGFNPNQLQMRVIEPAGLPPAIFIIDQVAPNENPNVPLSNVDENQQVYWPPLESVLQEARSLLVQTVRLILSEVSARVNDGRYNLDRWRRILTFIQPKAFARQVTADQCFTKNPATGRLTGLTPAALQDILGGAAKQKIVKDQSMNNIVSKLHSKQTTERKKRGAKGAPGPTELDEYERNNPEENDMEVLPPDEDTYNIYN